ncbi:hypothetical protein JL720_5142 [Aureococcus anophagefferens]|nr:hypothetical protein JL720_5142 [Aureococcus anophagefferens]
MKDKPGVRAPCAALFGKAARARFGASGDTIVFAVPSGGRETPDPLGRPVALATAVASAIDGVVHPLLSRRPGVKKLPSSGGRPARVAHLRNASFVSDAAREYIKQAFAAGKRRILGVDDDSWTKATRDEAVGALRAAIESLGLSGSMVVEFAVLFRKVGDAYPGDLRNELDAATHDEPGPAPTGRAARDALDESSRAAIEAIEAGEARHDHHWRCHRFSRICAVAAEDEERCEKNGHVVVIYRTGGRDRATRILHLYLGSHAVPKGKWSGDLKALVLALLAKGDAEAILQCVELVSKREGEHRDDVAAGRHSSIQDFYNENGGADAVELELVMLIFARADETRTELKIAGLDYEQVVDKETGKTVPVNLTQKALRKKKATRDAWTPQERAMNSQNNSFGQLLANAKKRGDAAGEAELKRQDEFWSEHAATATRLDVAVPDVVWWRRDLAAAAAALDVDVSELRDDEEIKAAAEKEARAAAEKKARAAAEAEAKARRPAAEAEAWRAVEVYCESKMLPLAIHDVDPVLVGPLRVRVLARLVLTALHGGAKARKRKRNCEGYSPKWLEAAASWCRSRLVRADEGKVHVDVLRDMFFSDPAFLAIVPTLIDDGEDPELFFDGLQNPKSAASTKFRSDALEPVVGKASVRDGCRVGGVKKLGVFGWRIDDSARSARRAHGRAVDGLRAAVAGRRRAVGVARRRAVAAGLANITSVATVDAQMVDASPLKLSLVSVGRRDRGMEHALGAINILGRSSESDASDPKKLPLGVDLGETNISRKQCTLKRRGDGAYVATTFGSNSTGVVPGGKRRRTLLNPGASRALELGDVVVLDIFEEHQSDVMDYSFAYQLRPRGGVMDDG